MTMHGQSLRQQVEAASSDSPRMGTCVEIGLGEARRILAALDARRDALVLDEQAIERAITGALRSCLDAHGGFLERVLIGSATKRIKGAVLAALRNEQEES